MKNSSNISSLSIYLNKNYTFAFDNYNINVNNELTVPVYDASYSSTNMIVKESAQITKGTLELNGNNQYVTIQSLTTTSAGVSFSFWMRANSSYGTYTVFDFANGSGNNNITFGLQNNTIYSQVVSDVSLGAVTFTPSAVEGTSSTNWLGGFAITEDRTKFFFSSEIGNLYYRTAINSSNIVIVTPPTGTSLCSLAITKNGSRLLWIVNGSSSSFYYATWDGTIYSNIISMPINSYCCSVSVTHDGNTAIIACNNNYLYFSKWNGTAYSNFVKIDGILGGYNGCDITSDGSKIAYSNGNNSIYYATWNGSNFTNHTLINGLAVNQFPISVKFSEDGNILFINRDLGLSCYSVWNNNAYSSIIDIPSTFLPSSNHPCFLQIYKNKIYSSQLASLNTNIYSTTFSTSKSTTQTGIYTTPVNDKIWRHYVWNINSSGTYTYYVNNTLVYTATGQSIPAAVTRTSNFIGKSNSLPLSYLSGAINEFRVYDKVLSASDVSSLYFYSYNYSDLQPNPVITGPKLYYRFYITDISGTKVPNYASGSAVYDASLFNTTIYKNLDHISTTGYLSLIPPNIVKINSLTTKSAGVSFAFWMRANNDSGTYTVFDFADGSGNNNITFGLQSNAIYSQVSGYPSVVNFTPYSTINDTDTTTQSGLFAIVISRDNSRIVISKAGSIFVNNFYDIDFKSGAASNFNYGCKSLFMTKDASRICWVFSGFGSGVSFATWNAATYVNETTFSTLSCTSIGGTDDGNTILVSRGFATDYLYMSTWNGNTYGTFTAITGIPQGKYNGCDMNWDGSKIAYTDISNNNVYYAVKSGSTYSNPTLIGTVGPGLKDVKFSNDGNILFMTSFSTTKCLSYSVWNGSGFSSIVDTSFNVIPYNTGSSYNAISVSNNKIYIINGSTNSGGGSNAIYKTTFFTSITQSRFYTTPVNDNVWRHYVWALDTSGNYKYYVNNSLVYTASGQSVPTTITRTSNFIGNSNSLPLSYFTGAIDDLRVYDKVLSVADVSYVYNN